MRCKLKDFCTVINGRAYSQKELLDKGKYRVLRVGNFFSSDRWYFSDLELPAEKYCNKGDLLFAWACSFGPRIWDGEDRTIFHYHIWKLDIDSAVVDKKYLYYLLKISVESMTTGTHGSVMMHITKSDMENFEFDIPTLEVQKKIAAILSALDEKIAINRAINDNLQQQLFSLYENMAMTSPCLKEYTLSNLCDFQEGYVNPTQTHPEYFDGEVKWLRAVDINESFIIETSRTLTKAGFESAKKSALLFKPNTIAISKSGTIGRLGIIADYMCGNRAVINIAPHDTNMLAFIYCFLKGKQREFPDMAVGSVQKNLYVSLLEPLSVSIPDNESLTAFNAVGASILGMIHNNCVENTNLANLRDTILPKLMSGEIDVSAVQF